MRLENTEGLAAFNCEPDHQNRTPGLSALVRLHNEENWIAACLESILDWHDEIVICLNLCTDRTPEIVERFRSAHPDKIKVYDYPFKIWEMGPRHWECSAESVHASAYYYNYTQSKTTRTHVLKVDGDLVFQDWAGEKIRGLMESHDRIKIFGTDLSEDPRYVGNHPVCPSNGVYRVRAGTHYAQGQMTQKIQNVPPHTAEVHDCFVHLKWCKSFESATVQWPDNWEEIPHFQRIAERRYPVARYEGEYPSSVMALL